MASGDRQPLTPRGAQTAARILDAATTVLGRDGFGGATLGRIADEAGIDKRGVLYHFGSREALLVRVVQTVGERIAANIDAEVRTTSAARPVDVLWAGITSEPQLLRAYFALVGGSAESEEVATALGDLKETYLRLIARRLHGAAAGRAAPIVTLALLRGLLLEWIETGDGPAIDAGLAELGAIAARG